MNSYHMGLKILMGHDWTLKEYLRHELNLPKVNLLDSWPLAFKSVVQTCGLESEHQVHR